MGRTSESHVVVCAYFAAINGTLSTKMKKSKEKICTLTIFYSFRDPEAIATGNSAAIFQDRMLLEITPPPNTSFLLLFLEDNTL